MRAVQMIKQTVATLLAAQLFFLVGLCGLVCCAPAQTVSAQPAPSSSSAQHASASGAQSHCHAKAEHTDAANKAATKPTAAGQHHKSQTARQNHQRLFVARLAEPACHCTLNAQDNPATASSQTESSAQTDKQFAFASLPSWRQADQAQPAPSLSPPTGFSHAPPFSGFQISLRI